MSKKQDKKQSKESLSKIKHEVASNLNIQPDEANAQLVSKQSSTMGGDIVKRLVNGNKTEQ